MPTDIKKCIQMWSHLAGLQPFQDDLTYRKKGGLDFMIIATTSVTTFYNFSTFNIVPQFAQGRRSF